MLRWVRVRALDLDEAFGADGLITATSPVQIGWIVQEADGAFAGILVQVNFDRLTVDKGILWKLKFSWGQVCLRPMP